MFDNVLTPVLVFTLLVGGTFAIGHELVAPPKRSAPSAPVVVVHLPSVTVTAQRSELSKIKVARVAPGSKAQFE